MKCKFCEDRKGIVEVFIHYEQEIYKLNNFCIECLESYITKYKICFLCKNKCTTKRELYIHYEYDIAKIGYLCVKCDPLEKERQLNRVKEYNKIPANIEKHKKISLKSYHRNKNLEIIDV